jgi:LysM repeat protein
MSKARHARTRRSRRVVRTLSIAGLGAGITAAGAGAAFATDYTVKPGDTLAGIAQANGTSWRDLAQLNGLGDPNLILAGQTLRLDGTKRYAVRAERHAGRSEGRSTHKYRKAERSERSYRTHRTERSRSNRSDRTSGNAHLSGGWSKVAACESGGNPRAVNPAGYYGLFQFDRQTWRSVGGSGNPANASAGEQVMRAKRLYAQRGASPWPVCGRHLR